MISPSGSLHLSRVMSPQEKAARAPSIRGLTNRTPTCVSKIGLKDVVALTKKMWRYVLVTLLKRLIHHAWGNICQRRPRKHIWWCLMRQRKEIHGLGNGFKNLCPSKKPARLWFDNWQNLWIFAKIMFVTVISGRDGVGASGRAGPAVEHRGPGGPTRRPQRVAAATLRVGFPLDYRRLWWYVRWGARLPEDAPLLG